MGYIIVSPRHSYVQFDAPAATEDCIWGNTGYCLPLLADDDIAFQFVVQADTEAEADALCTISDDLIEIGLIRDCDQVGFDVQFAEIPERYRISPLQVLYNWSHGLPGAIVEFNINECFYIRVQVNGTSHCSNCFQRIDDECFTNILEYGNDENFGGFNYCNSGSVDSGDQPDGSCAATEIEFINKENITIPYTAGLAAMYGPMPSVSVWIYNMDGILQNIGVVATFDSYPVNTIYIDFGGISSGVIKLR